MAEQSSQRNGNGGSVHSALGGGKIADILLWKNQKVSGGMFSGATILWFLFEVLEFHVLTIFSQGLLLALIVLFVWSCGAKLIRRTPPRIQRVMIREEQVMKFASALRIELNRALATLNEIASGNDLKKFLWMNTVLALVSIIGGYFNFLTLLHLATVLLFTVPFAYDRYEDQVNYLAQLIKKYYQTIDAKLFSKIPRGKSRN